MATRATTILNSQGDLTIVWDEADDEIMAEVIRRKMAEGVVFFVIQPRMGGLMAPAKMAASRAEDVVAQRAFSIEDRDIRAFVFGEVNALPAPAPQRALSAPVETVDADETPPVKRGRTARAVKTPDAQAKTVRKTKDPKEAAQNETVGVRQMRGG